ncbi:uncharacterized protein B0I36DRAFT_333698, partial [Microdochium trichocladiopsis]
MLLQSFQSCARLCAPKLPVLLIVVSGTALRSATACRTGLLCKLFWVLPAIRVSACTMAAVPTECIVARWFWRRVSCSRTSQRPRAARGAAQHSTAQLSSLSGADQVTIVLLVEAWQVALQVVCHRQARQQSFPNPDTAPSRIPRSAGSAREKSHEGLPVRCILNT